MSDTVRKALGWMLEGAECVCAHTREPPCHVCRAREVYEASPEASGDGLARNPATGDFVWCRCGDAIRCDDAVCGNCHAAAAPPPAPTVPASEGGY